MLTPSFITANYVARALNYRGPADWMPNNDATIAAASAEHFLQIVQDVVAAGFESIDIWTAHCHWLHHDTEDYLEQIKGYCSQFDLTISSYAGGMDNVTTAADLDKPFRLMKQLGAPLFAGGIRGLPSPQMCALVNESLGRYGLKWGFENHPGEKSVAEILERIDGGRHDRIGAALDTGWCGTMGFDALEAVQRLCEMNKLFIIHLKDVTEAGKHDTCTLGDGIVGIEKVVRYLKQSGWSGTLCIEHEPFDHDPTEEIVTSRLRVLDWIG